jgi:hypothetical protein
MHFRWGVLRYVGVIALGWCWMTGNAVAQEPSLDESARRGVFIILEDAAVPLAIIGHAPESLGTGRTRRLEAAPSQDNFSHWVIATRALPSRELPEVRALEGRSVRVVSNAGSCDAHLGRPVVARLRDSAVMRWESELRGETGPVRPAQELRQVWASSHRIVVAPIVGACQGGILATTQMQSAPRIFGPAPTSEERNRSLAALYRASAQGVAVQTEFASYPEGWDEPVVRVDSRWTLGDGRDLALLDAPIYESCATNRHPLLIDSRSSPSSEIAMVGPSTLSAVFDLEGDGVLELVFTSDDWWHVNVVRLPLGASAFTPVTNINLRESMGC